MQIQQLVITILVYISLLLNLNMKAVIAALISAITFSQDTGTTAEETAGDTAEPSPGSTS